MSDFFSNLLSQLSMGNKTNVGVSISLNLGLEMVVVDPGTRKVSKYANRPLEYNPLTREIEDYNSFRIALNELFQELKIQPAKANVVMNLPNVLFGHTFLPTVLDDEAVTTALTSEVEQNYLFKKNSPSVSWVEVNANNKTENRYILYSAVQESIVNSIKQVFDELGANLVAIENTNSSLIKTLEFTEITKGLIAGDPSWNILLVSQNSYAVFSMLEHNVIEYYEDPLAIKSFSGDEVYLAIAQAANGVLAKYPTDKLLIISETNDVSAEILAIQMKHQGHVIFLECNKYAKHPLMDIDLNILPNYVNSITPEAIGAAIYSARKFALQLNFLSVASSKAPDSIELNLFGQQLEMTRDQLLIYTAVIALLIAGACYGVNTAIKGISTSLSDQKAQVDQEIATLTAELSDLQKDKNKVDIYTAAKSIDKSMKDKVLYFASLGAEIPAKVWLNKFYADAENAYSIEGETTSVNDLYLFYRSIKSLVPESDLILSNLKVDDQGGVIDIGDTSNAKYTFSLTNRAYNAALARAAAVAAAAANPDGVQATPDGKIIEPGAELPKEGEDKGSFNVPKIQDLPPMQ